MIGIDKQPAVSTTCTTQTVAPLLSRDVRWAVRIYKPYRCAVNVTPLFQCCNRQPYLHSLSIDDDTPRSACTLATKRRINIHSYGKAEKCVNLKDFLRLNPGELGAYSVEPPHHRTMVSIMVKNVCTVVAFISLVQLVRSIPARRCWFVSFGLLQIIILASVMSSPRPSLYPRCERFDVNTFFETLRIPGAQTAP